MLKKTMYRIFCFAGGEVHTWKEVMPAKFKGAYKLKTHFSTGSLD